MARPRIHSVDTSPQERLEMSRAAAAQRGAKLIQIRLEVDELAALERLRRPGETIRDCIARLILAAS